MYPVHDFDISVSAYFEITLIKFKKVKLVNVLHFFFFFSCTSYYYARLPLIYGIFCSKQNLKQNKTKRTNLK